MSVKCLVVQLIRNYCCGHNSFADLENEMDGGGGRQNKQWSVLNEWQARPNFQRNIRLL